MAFRCVPTLQDCFSEVARIVFEETARSRRQLHTVRGGLGCDAVFEFTGTFEVRGGCPCVDEYIDALVLVWQYLSALDPATVRSYGALARTHCRVRVIHEVQRQRRGRQSQQRTDRLENSAIGRALDTDEQRALLVHVVQEAGSAAPLSGDAQLLIRLAELRAERSGGDAASHVDGVWRDLALVRAAAIEHGGRKRDSAGVLVSWWEFYVETGLGRRERLNTVPIGAAPEPVDGDCAELDVPDPGAERAVDELLDRGAVAAVAEVEIDEGLDGEAALARSLADAAGAAQQGVRDAAVRARLLALAEHGALPWQVVHAVVTDSRRLREVALAARDLRHTVSCSAAC